MKHQMKYRFALSVLTAFCSACAFAASRLVISMRSPGKFTGSYILADVGSVVGEPKLAEGLKGWRLTVEDGRRIVLSSEGMFIFIR